jgi:multiple sugar transport system permease protein
MRIKKNKVVEVVMLIIVALNVLFFLFPTVQLIFTSLKPSKYLLDSLFPPLLTFEHYKGIFPEPVVKPLINSLIVASASTGLVLIVSLLGAFSLTKFQYKRREDISFFILSLYMLPPVILIIPVWRIAQQIGLLDTHLFLIFMHTLYNLPLTVWLLRSFFAGIPPELEEASMIDGCSKMGSLVRITLPLATPGIAVAGIFAFIFSWNEFLFATVLTRIEAVTLPVTIGAQIHYYIKWGPLTALASIAIIPMLILTVLIQKHIVAGLTLGAIK